MKMSGNSQKSENDLEGQNLPEQVLRRSERSRQERQRTTFYQPDTSELTLSEVLSDEISQILLNESSLVDVSSDEISISKDEQNESKSIGVSSDETSKLHSCINKTDKFQIISDNLKNSFSQSPKSSHQNQISAMTEAQVKQWVTECYAGIEPSVQGPSAPSRQDPPLSLKFMPVMPEVSKDIFVTWERRMRAVLKLNRIWVDEGEAPLTAEEQEKSDLAVEAVVLCLNRKNSSSIINKENEKDIRKVWKKLHEVFQPHTPLTLCDFYSFVGETVHQQGSCIRAFLNDWDSQFNRLDEINASIEEKHKIAMVLASTRKSAEFRHLFVSAQLVDCLTLSSVKQALINSQDQSKRDDVQQCNSVYTNSKEFHRQNVEKRQIKSHNRKPANLRRGFNCRSCERDNHSWADCKFNPKNQKDQPSTSYKRSFQQKSHANVEESDRTDENGNSSNDVNVAHFEFQSHSVQTGTSLVTNVKSRLGPKKERISPYEPRFLVQQRLGSRDEKEIILPDDDISMSDDGYNDDALIVRHDPHDTLGNKNNSKQKNFNKSLLFQKPKNLGNLKSFDQKSAATCEIYEFLMNSNEAGINKNTQELNKIFLNEMSYSAHEDLILRNKILLNSNTDSRWILDSGATTHLCGSVEYLSNFRLSQGQKVTVSNGSSLPIEGFGDLNFMLKDSNNIAHFITLKRVAFVPQIVVNLISVPVLTRDYQASIMFTKDECFMERPGIKVKIGELKQNAYVLIIEHSNLTENKAFVCIHEWHKKLGHRNIDHIRRIKTSLNLPISKCNCTDDCISCIR